MKRRAAFTLVEILLAFACLLAFTVGVFMILQRFTRAGGVGQWRSTVTGQIRKAQERLRQQIEAGAYPMLITPQANNIAELPAHYVILNPEGGGTAVDTATEYVRVFGPGTGTGEPSASDTPILQLVKSRPGRQGLGATAQLADKDVEATRVKLFLRGKTKVYGQTIKWNQSLFMTEEYNNISPGGFSHTSEFSFTGGKVTETLLANDVNRVSVSVSIEAMKGSAVSTSPVAVEVNVACVDPSEGQARIETTVRAQPSCGVEVK
ncbi:MAG: hypothetical protein HY814_14125 [Candidatus Riflebacteria bacterium]|nr:hypothetical protein [Candidatus Riflebacteria bacterium]